MIAIRVYRATLKTVSYLSITAKVGRFYSAVSTCVGKRLLHIIVILGGKFLNAAENNCTLSSTIHVIFIPHTLVIYLTNCI